MKLRFVIILYVLTMSVCLAQIPNAISYQGLIINPTTGETAANGEHAVKFAFYDAAVGGNLKWQTSIIQVTTFKGLFATIIPVPANAAWDQSLFVELTVDAFVLPARVQLTTVPYAFKALSADVALTMNASGLTGTIASSNLPAELQDLATGTIAGSRIGPGINASNIDNGTLPNSVLNEHLQDLSDGTLSASKVENLDAAKITTGTFDPARIPNLDVSKITGLTPGGNPGTEIDAASITSGTLAPARLGVVPVANLSGTIANTNLDADLVDLVDGSLTGSKVGTGINATNITAGTLDPAQLGAVPAANLSGTIANTNLDDDLVDLADGTLSGQKVGSNITANNVNVGTLPNTVLADDLQDLADGVLTGSKVGTGIDATNITAGILPVNRGGTGVTTAANGQLLIGNGTGFSVATLTAGAGIGISNIVPGAITISNSMPQATSLQNGYLSYTDWNTFNNKLSTFTNQNQNLVYAGPSIAPAAAPTFRPLVEADIPALSFAKLPSTVATANNGVTGQLAYWTSATQLSADGLTWNATNNELGVGTANPAASIHIVHNNTHPTLVGLKIESSANNAGVEALYGSRIDATSTSPFNNAVYGTYSNASGSANSDHTGLIGRANSTGSGNNVGVDGVAEGEGTGDKHGVRGSSYQTGTTKYGVSGYVSGSGPTGYGVYGEATGGTNRYGIYGTASGGGTNSFGVYGTASGAANNYAVYAAGNLHVTGNITYSGTITDLSPPSDKKLKTDIRLMSPMVEKIMQLNPYTYFFRTHEFKRLNLSERKQNGLIAQDVEKIFPELVIGKTIPEQKSENGKMLEPEFSYKSLDYTSLIPILIKGMQEQQAMIDELTAKVKKLEAESQHPNSEKRFVKASLKEN